MDHLERTANNQRQNVSPLFSFFVTAFITCVLPMQTKHPYTINAFLNSIQTLFPARVCGIINESETVKRLRIEVHPDFSFKAGQW